MNYLPVFHVGGTSSDQCCEKVKIHVRIKLPRISDPAFEIAVRWMKRLYKHFYFKTTKYGRILPQAIIFIFAAIVCVPIAKRLGMGQFRIPWMLGIVIGPYLLDLLEEGEISCTKAEFGGGD